MRWGESLWVSWPLRPISAFAARQKNPDDGVRAVPADIAQPSAQEQMTLHGLKFRLGQGASRSSSVVITSLIPVMVFGEGERHGR